MITNLAQFVPQLFCPLFIIPIMKPSFFLCPEWILYLSSLLKNALHFGPKQFFKMLLHILKLWFQLLGCPLVYLSVKCLVV